MTIVTVPRCPGSVSLTADDGSDHPLVRDADDVDRAIREGRFQRWLALVAGASSAAERLGSRVRALPGQLQPPGHVHARPAERRVDDRRNRRLLQRARRANAAAGSFGDHRGRQRFGVLLSRSGRRSQARRVATARGQHGDGTARVRPAAVSASALTWGCSRPGCGGTTATPASSFPERRTAATGPRTYPAAREHRLGSRRA